MKLLIEVQGNKPLSEYGDNHVIAYDSNKKSYYVTTAKSFFAEQNLKIKNMAEEVNALKNNLNSMRQELAGFEDMIKSKTNGFEENINNRFDSFLHNYQTANAKVLEMVEKLVEEE